MSGRSVVVTGAGAGIGRAIAERLARVGWLVAGLERDAATAAELGAALGDRGTVIAGDVLERAALERAADAALALAPLRGWVNNAGITQSAPLPGHSEELVRTILAVNLEATFWGCETAVRAFLEHSAGGAIVNISSIHGRRGFPDHAAYDATKGAIDALTRNVAVAQMPFPQMAVYGATKAAIAALTDVAAIELARYGITVNHVGPGWVTSYINDASPALQTEEDVRGTLALNPLGRPAEPREVGRAVVYLSLRGRRLRHRRIPADRRRLRRGQALMSRSLQGKVAVVVGGTGKLGAGVVAKLAAHGASVGVVHDGRRPSAAMEAALSGAAPRSRFVELNVEHGDAESADALVERLSAELGAIDILVYNAHHQLTGDFLSTELADAPSTPPVCAARSPRTSTRYAWPSQLGSSSSKQDNQNRGALTQTFPPPWSWPSSTA